MNLSIQWSSDLATGIDIIDQQHQRLILCLDEVNEAIDSGDRELIELVIQQLIDFCTSHNDFEESLMAEAGYPMLDAHSKQHESFRLRANSYALQMNTGQEPLQIARHIRTDLAIWLTNHIQHEDQHYVPWVKRHLNPRLFDRMWQQLFSHSQADNQSECHL